MKIKYLLAAFMLVALSCSGQIKKGEQGSIDTAKLFDPNPEPPSFRDMEMFKNCVRLDHQLRGLVIQAKEFKVTSEKELFDKIKNDTAEVTRSKFYILIDSSFSFNRINKIIGNLKRSGVTNYKVINIDSYFKSPEPGKIELPSSVTVKTIDSNDSSYFSITLLNDGFEAALLGKNQVLKDSAEADRFIKDNKALINRNKILVIGSAREHYASFKAIIAILKNNEYLKFQMLSNKN